MLERVGVLKARKQRGADPSLLLPLTIVVWQEEDQWVSQCAEFYVASSGETADEAVEEAVDAVCSYLNTIEALGERERVFAERSIAVYASPPAEFHFHLKRELLERQGVQVRPVELPLANREVVPA